MSTIGPTGSIPIHIARAYGVTPSNRPINTGQQAPSTDGIGPINRHIQPGSPPAPTSRLVAARVPGGIDFIEDSPVQTRSGQSIGGAPSGPNPAGVYQMYAHPADRNAAATAVNAGRLIDLEA